MPVKHKSELSQVSPPLRFYSDNLADNIITHSQADSSSSRFTQKNQTHITRQRRFSL